MRVVPGGCKTVYLGYVSQSLLAGVNHCRSLRGLSQTLPISLDEHPPKLRASARAFVRALF